MMDEFISYFNQEVSKMNISQEDKLKLLGMITAIGYESKKRKVVRCEECKHVQHDVIFDQWWCRGREVTPNWFCADGEKKK